MQAGANSAITQYFYNADAYFRFIDGCTQRGIDIPVVPGIMPISHFEQLARFLDTQRRKRGQYPLIIKGAMLGLFYQHQTL